MAIPTATDPAPPSRNQRFRGCLLAGAIGDALGAPVEFMSRNAIHAHFGAGGITDLAQAYGRVGAITDDTQMTLFTAEGLLRAFVRHASRGITTYPGVVASAYLRWLRSQDEDRDVVEEADGWLISHRQLHARRAPGNTCLSALWAMQAAKCGGRPANNNSKGCGGVMRVAPVGLFASHWHDHAKAFDLACQLAALTHGHPTGQLPAGVLASLVHDLSLGHGLDPALDRAMAVLAERDDADETITALGNARSLASETIRGNCAPSQALSRLGEGWIAEEALAMSVYCALVANDLRDGLILAVNHGGDSDSTGAITGKAMDNRASVAALTQLLHNLQGRTHQWDVLAAATVQEEVTLGGGRTIAWRTQPDLAIVIDTGWAIGTGVGEDDGFKLGEGPTLLIGPNAHPKLFHLIREKAEALEIALHAEPIPRHSGTEGWEVQVSRDGVPTAIISIPIRNMHTPVEMVSLKDIRRVARLVAEFIGDLDETTLDRLALDAD